MRTLSVSGTPEEMGRQHGRQVRDLRDHLASTIAQRLADLRRLDAERPERLRPAVEALEELDIPLLAFLQGVASSLELDYGQVLRYTLSSYLRDLHEAGAAGEVPMSPSEGCTTWAASGFTTKGEVTLLAKNRDYHRDHIPLQALVQVAPASGYRYLAIGSAGSPDVFSSGINQRGLAVADTHVLSRDLGPGLARFSLMRELLQYHPDTRSGLDYLRSVPHMGGGTLILADRSGHLAVCESGHTASGWVECRQGFLVSTNHFETEALAAQWIENEPPALQGNSPARHHRVTRALVESGGQVDVPWAQGLMTTHGSPLDALCRHPLTPQGQPPQPGLDSSTISSAIFLPAGLSPGQDRPTLLLAAGQPCQATWQTRHVT